MTLTAQAVGVDIGSNSARAIAIDSEGSVIASSQARYTGRAKAGEIDPEIWMSGLLAAVSSLDVGPPAALGIGGYGPCTVSSSGETALTFRYPVGDSGNPRDQHAAQAAELRSRLGSDIDPMLPWDWLVARLGSRSGTQSVWPGDQPLPEFGVAVGVGSAVGQTSGEFGLAEGIPLVPATNDGYLTAWAAGIDRPGRGFDPGGSTGGIGVAVSGVGSAEPYGIPSAVPGILVAGGPVAAHGAMLGWWARTTGRDIDELLIRAGEVPPGSHGVLVLPFLEGERAPRWNTDLRAEIVGLHSSHDVGVVTRAILEGTAYGLAHIVRSLEDRGIVLERLVCCGKPSTSELWSSIKAAVLGVPVDVPEHREMAAYGAALAAGAAINWWPVPGAGRSGDWPMPRVITIESRPLEVYADQLERFIELGDAAEARLRDEQHVTGRRV